ncbi:MAG: adenylate kinase family protein [Methanoregula sp.]|nr:MAG: adenylate kinase family protein [Methanoregula sp.]
MMCGITGTPGTGKSMVADELARRGHTIVRLVDTVKPYITGEDEDRHTQEFDAVKWAREFPRVDGFVEGHFSHLLSCDRVVVLRCRPDELKKRLMKRNYPATKVSENVEAEALDVCLIETVDMHDPSHILEIDTTALKPAYCATRIERFVHDEIPAEFGRIDWSMFVEAGM